MIDPMEIDPITRNLFNFLRDEGFNPSLSKEGETYSFTATDPETGQTQVVNGDDLDAISREIQDKLGLDYHPRW